MEKDIWAVVDEGCQECGVDSVPIGLYFDKEKADKAAKQRHKKTGGFRDGGQALVYIHHFVIECPVDCDIRFVRATQLP